ncbi:unnamed protein product [Sympodiomycopsis kandeliae]
MMNEDTENGFTYVQHKKKSRNRPSKSAVNKARPQAGVQRKLNAQQILAQNDSEDGKDILSEEELHKVKEYIESHRRMLRHEKMGEKVAECFNAFVQMLSRRRVDVKGKSKAIDDGDGDATGLLLPSVIYALGMGSVSSNRTAQIQLAFLLELREHLESVHQGKSDTTVIPIKAYDPISTKADIQLQSSYGITHSSRKSISPDHPITLPTLLYMPHCPRPLYNSYLTSSFTPANLSNIILCSNRLERYEEFLPPKTIQDEMPAIWRLIPYLESVNIPVDSDGALSDLAFQVFNSHKEIRISNSNSSNSNDRNRRRKTKNNISSSSGQSREDQPQKPTLDQEAFWTLPPRQESEADKEVL